MQAPSGEIKMFPKEVTQEQSMKEGLVPIERDMLPHITSMDKSQRKNWMRNHPCICKSGKKFKNCCWGNYK